MIVAMNGTATALGDYRPVGGALCLDFANTVEWHDSDHPVELLSNAGCLSAWTRIVGPGGVEVDGEIGRASGRERVCQYGEISVVAVSLKKKHIIRQTKKR